MSFVRLRQIIRVLLTLFQPMFLSISLRTSENLHFYDVSGDMEAEHLLKMG